jgi:hypothetical protein
VLPYTISNYLRRSSTSRSPTTIHEFAKIRAGGDRPLQAVPGHRRHRSPDYFHRELGKIIWDYCGMERNQQGSREGAVGDPGPVRGVPEGPAGDRATTTSINQTLEKAGRVEDFFELGMLMCNDALDREESCGGHFRSEYQTDEGEALRDDDNFAHVSAWEWTGDPEAPTRAQGASRVRSRQVPDPELQVKTLTNLTLKIWRQDGPDAGRFETHQIPEISDEASFLELLDILNERLIEEGKEAIVFDHDCREGICGTCSLMIDGRAHGPQKGTATCQVHMRVFDSGDEIVIEPFRASAFPIIKDLMVDRAAFDRIVESGGYITAPPAARPTPT